MNYDLNALRTLAEAAAKSRLLPNDVNGADAAFYIMAAGVEMGFQPVESLRAIALVKGKVSVSAQGQLALALKRGIRQKIEESTPTVCRITLSRDGSEPFTLAYTIEDAQRAGLTGSQTWKAHPAAMLRARAATAAIRAYCPDVLLGAYDPDEVAEIADRDTRPAVKVLDARPAAPALTGPAMPDADTLGKAVRWLSKEALFDDVIATHGEPQGWTLATLDEIRASAARALDERKALALPDAADPHLNARRQKRIDEARAAGRLDEVIAAHGKPATWDHTVCDAVKAMLDGGSATKRKQDPKPDDRSEAERYADRKIDGEAA